MPENAVLPTSESSGVEPPGQDSISSGAAVERFARLLVHRRRWVIALSVLLTAVVLAAGSGALGVLSLSRIASPGSESDQARSVLAAQFRTGPPNLVFLVDAGDRGVDDPAVRAAGDQLTRDIASSAGVAEAGSYWSRETARRSAVTTSGRR